MIYAKTKMKRIPKTCKECTLTLIQFNQLGFDKYCSLTGKLCPMEKKANGNYGYTKPKWCPLIIKDDIEED